MRHLHAAFSNHSSDFQTAHNIQGNMSCAQPYSRAKPSAVHIPPGTGKCKCTVPLSPWKFLLGVNILSETTKWWALPPILYPTVYWWQSSTRQVPAIQTPAPCHYFCETSSALYKRNENSLPCRLEHCSCLSFGDRPWFWRHLTRSANKKKSLRQKASSSLWLECFSPEKIKNELVCYQNSEEAKQQTKNKCLEQTEKIQEHLFLLPSRTERDTKTMVIWTFTWSNTMSK